MEVTDAVEAVDAARILRTVLMDNALQGTHVGAAPKVLNVKREDDASDPRQSIVRMS